MMKLNEIRDNPGARRSKMRIGRGIGSGKGKTGGRGYKGQKSRTGVSINGFEGGQMPLQRRVPKFGFTNINRKEYQGINLDTLQALVESGKITDTVNLDTLIALRLAGKNDLVKILGNGELKAKLNITVHKYTATAKAAIEAAGGEAVTL